MKVNVFPRESRIILDFEANKELPEAERVVATIRWPTQAESGDLPEMEFEEVPAPPEDPSKQETPQETPDTEEKVQAPRRTRHATKKSLHVFSDAVMRRQVVKIENLEGISTGAELADLPAGGDLLDEIFWSIIIAYRAGPGAVIEKKKD